MSTNIFITLYNNIFDSLKLHLKVNINFMSTIFGGLTVLPFTKVAKAAKDLGLIYVGIHENASKVSNVTPE